MPRWLRVVLLTIASLVALASIVVVSIPRREWSELGVVGLALVIGVPSLVPTLLTAGLMTFWVRREWLAALLWLACLFGCSVVNAFEVIMEGRGGSTWAFDEPFRAFVIDRWWLLVTWAIVLAFMPRAFELRADDVE